jgi:osmotically-inducible protein OsmY
MGDTEAEVAPALSKLAQLVLALRKTDPDYNGLVVEVRGGVVMIRGTARDDRIPWAFANKVRTLPGVERVILSTR